MWKGYPPRICRSIIDWQQLKAPLTHSCSERGDENCFTCITLALTATSLSHWKITSMDVSLRLSNSRSRCIRNIFSIHREYLAAQAVITVTISPAFANSRCYLVATFGWFWFRSIALSHLRHRAQISATQPSHWVFAFHRNYLKCTSFEACWKLHTWLILIQPPEPSSCPRAALPI